MNDAPRTPVKLRFRYAIAEDAAALAAMNHQLIADEGHRNPMSVAQLQKRMRDWLAGDYTAVLFERGGGHERKSSGGAAVGYALYRFEPDYVYLRQFFVSRESRRQGVGRAAMSWLLRHAWDGAPRVRIEVLIDNESAIAFWRAVGFGDYCITMERECEGE